MFTIMPTWCCSVLALTINDELEINDPANANNILAASRTVCHFIGVSLTFNPQQVIPQGTMVEAAQLPTASQLRIYFRAPQNAGGGLLNAITKDMLLNHTTDIFRLVGVPSFLAIKHGQIPNKDVYDAWIEDQCNQAYFAAMKQIAQKIYIGEEVATDTLRQRFLKLSQRKYNPSTRKTEYLTVSEFHSEIVALINETADMDQNTINQQVPELDSLLYHGLLARLQQRQELAAATNHAPSANLGENLANLQNMVNLAKVAEHEINQMVSISLGSNYRRNAVAGNNPPVGRAYLSQQLLGSAESSPMRQTLAAAAVPGSAPRYREAGMTSMETFALTMLSNAERALRESSNTNAPVQCWGCTGLYPDNDHLYKDCPHKEIRAVQEQFQGKLNEFLARRKNQSRFNPSHYKRDGFLTKTAATMFNDICNSELDGQTRQALISTFVGEWLNAEQGSGNNVAGPVAANTRR